MKFTFTTLMCSWAPDLLLAISVVAQPSAPPLTREQWGAPLVKLTHTNGQWVIAGKKNQVSLITATEAGSDWVIPHVDIVNQSGSVGKCVPVPLYNLVYHDAVLISYGAGRSGGDKNLLLGILCGGVPELPVANDTSEETLTLIRKMAALNKRVALLEMIGHEFLDASRSEERTTFADGTMVTVDWNAKTVQIQPDLNEC